MNLFLIRFVDKFAYLMYYYRTLPFIGLNYLSHQSEYFYFNWNFNIFTIGLPLIYVHYNGEFRPIHVPFISIIAVAMYNKKTLLFKNITKFSGYFYKQWKKLPNFSSLLPIIKITFKNNTQDQDFEKI